MWSNWISYLLLLYRQYFDDIYCMSWNNETNAQLSDEWWSFSKKVVKPNRKRTKQHDELTSQITFSLMLSHTQMNNIKCKNLIIFCKNFSWSIWYDLTYPGLYLRKKKCALSRWFVSAQSTHTLLHVMAKELWSWLCFFSPLWKIDYDSANMALKK